MKVAKFTQTKPTPFRMVYKKIVDGFGSSVNTHNWTFDKWKDSKSTSHKVWQVVHVIHFTKTCGYWNIF
jgi:hypothetical protein